MLHPTTPPPITTALAVFGRSTEEAIVPRFGAAAPATTSAEARDQLAIGGREIECLEAFGRHPFHRLRLTRLDRSRLEAATIEMNDHRPCRVVPPDGLDSLADREARRELLGELSPKRFLERLAGFALAARELPHTRQVRAAAALGDQIATLVVLDQRRHDLDELRQAGRWRRSASWDKG